jgi:transcriptional regulator with XRE-family HTH domain/quercetin dioxygenase-like cupin family protein
MTDTHFNHARAIGEKLRTVRQRRRISLRDLARRAEMSASMLSQIETGKTFPSVRSIYSIAAALDVPVDYFFPDPNSVIEGATDDEEQRNNSLTASEMRQAKVGRAVDLGMDNPPRARPPVTVIHADGRPTIELNGGVTWARLTGSAEPDVEFLEVAYAPGATSGANMSHHLGREFGLVLEGELVVELGFESHALGCGDSIIFDSTTPHRLSNRGDQPMRALWVVLSRV